MLSPADEALLNDLLDGRLSPAEAARLRARIASDSTLRMAFEGLERVRALLRDDMGLEVPADLPGRVRAQHEAGAPAAEAQGAVPGAGRAPSLPPAWRRVIVAAYALAAMLVVAVGAIALQHGRQQDAAPLLDARARWAREVPSGAPQEAEGEDASRPAALAAGPGQLEQDSARPAREQDSARPAREQDSARPAREQDSARPARKDAGPSGSTPAAAAPPRAPPASGAVAPAAAPDAAAGAPSGAPAADDPGWSLPPEEVRKAKAEAYDHAQDLQRERAAAPRLRAPAEPAQDGEASREQGEKDARAPAGPGEAGERAPRDERARRDEPGRLSDREAGQAAAPAGDGAAAGAAPRPALGSAVPFQAPGGAVAPGLRRAVPSGESQPPPAREVPPAPAEAQAARATQAAREAREAEAALEHVFVIEAASADEARAVLERVLAGPGADALPPEPGFTAVRLRRADAQQDAALLVSLGVLPPPAPGAPSARPGGGGGGGSEAGRGAARAPTLPRVLADVQRAVDAEQYGRLAALAGRRAQAPEAARALAGPDLRLLRILVVAPQR